jgi:hypothetical protein
MNQQETASSTRIAPIASRQKGQILSPGNCIRVIRPGPFRGIQGTIYIVHAITADLEELFCFYLVALEKVQIKDLVWFSYDEVEAYDYLHSSSVL